MAASMINSVPNFYRIHPYKILNLIVPHHIKLLLADGTRLVGKRWVGWYGNVLVLGVGSGERCGKGCSRCIRGGIRERNILRVVARFDPFLNYSMGEIYEVTVRLRTNSSTYQLRFWPRLAESASR